jgi:hypothetical protein
MGVEYQHFLIPRDNTVRPTPDRIAALIEAWLAAGFIVRPGSEALAAMVFSAGSPAKSTGALRIKRSGRNREADAFAVPCDARALAVLGEPSALIQWPVDNTKLSGTHYPMEPVPDLRDVGPYYQLELRICADYVNESSETLDGLWGAECACECGKALDYTAAEDDPLWVGRIRHLCPDCGTEFRPQDHMSEGRDGFTGKGYELRGGACYRFAIVIDCGKCFIPEPQATAVFLQTCSNALGVELYQVGSYG